jgi:hydroxymethylpyrimidine/phosphomethylpyrimidine kinase
VTPDRIPRLLSIAGSDSGGGAGIQADLKAFAACGVHGMTAITAITAQNTVGVTAVHTIPPEIIVAQVRAVATDIGVDAVKIGMLGTVETIEAVATAIGELPAETPVVIDPVMVAESGAELLEPAARRSLIDRLLPRATVVTPNVPEARALAGESSGAGPGGGSPGGAGPGGASPGGASPGGASPGGASPGASSPGGAEPGGAGTDDDAEALIRRVHALGPRYVVVTGGHRATATDLFFDGREIVEIEGERFPDGAAHGSGCTHSSVLAARLAWGDQALEAARHAKTLASRAVADGLTEMGAGAGPVDVLGLRRRMLNTR